MENKETIKNKSLKQKVLGYMLNHIKTQWLSVLILTLVYLCMYPGADILVHLLGKYGENNASITEISAEIFYVLATGKFAAVAITSFLAVVALMFLHNKRQLDFYLSIPLSRVSLLFSRILKILWIIFIPFLISMFIGAIYGHSIPGVWTMTGLYVVRAIILVLANIALGTFICVCCGRTIDAVVVYVLYNGSFALIFAVVASMIQIAIPGAISNIQILEWAKWGCPLLLLGFDDMLLNCWWIFMTIVLFVASGVLMKKRKSEVAQDKFAFRIIEIVVEFITEILCALTCGFFAASICESGDARIVEEIWFVAGAVFGAFVSHTIMHFIFTRSKVGYFKSLLRSIPPCAISIITMIIIVTGGLGYDTYIPSEDEVKNVKVYISNDDFYVGNTNILKIGNTDKKVISEAIEVHNKIVDEATSFKQSGIYSLQKKNGNGVFYDYEGYESSFTIEYQLKNGKTIKRRYVDEDTNANFTEQVSDLIDKTKSQNALMLIPKDFLSSVDLTNYKTGEPTYYSFTTGELKEYEDDFNNIINSYISEKAQNKKGKTIYVLALNFRDKKDNIYYEELEVKDCYKETIKMIENSLFLNEKYLAYCWNNSFDNYDIASDGNAFTSSDEEVYFKLPDNWIKDEPVYAMPAYLYSDLKDIEDVENIIDYGFYCRMNKNMSKEYVCSIDESSDGSVYKWKVPNEKEWKDGVVFYQRSDDDFYCSTFMLLKNNIGKMAVRKSDLGAIDIYNYNGEKFIWEDYK